MRKRCAKANKAPGGLASLVASAPLVVAAASCFELPPPLEHGAGGEDITMGRGGGGGSGGAAAAPCAFVEDGVCVQVVDLDAGGDHTCALFSDGTVRCWGSNEAGQLGDPERAASFSEKPHTVAIEGRVTDITLARNTSCATLDTGAVWCWGDNLVGTVGNGSSSNVIRTPVEIFPDSVTHMAGAGSSLCAVRGADVLCWGVSLNGQPWLGVPENFEHNRTPLPTGGFEDVASIDRLAVSSTPHACAIVNGGAEVRCWGDNEQGGLGDGTMTPSATAVPVTSLTVPVGILSAGSNSTCAVSETGDALFRVSCWGLLDWAGTIAVEPSVSFEFDEEILLFDGGWRHHCFVMAGGEVRCFGVNVRSQLGLPNSAPEYVAVPTPAGNIDDASKLTVGRHHTCVVRADGTVWCFGENARGQLGNGEVASEERHAVQVRW